MAIGGVRRLGRLPELRQDRRARSPPNSGAPSGAGELPAALPHDEDFAFGSDADRLARAYEGGWLACDLIAGHWGEARLTDFYRAVGVVTEGERAAPGAVEKAMREVLSTTPADFHGALARLSAAAPGLTRPAGRSGAAPGADTVSRHSARQASSDAPTSRPLRTTSSSMPTGSLATT